MPAGDSTLATRCRDCGAQNPEFNVRCCSCGEPLPADSGVPDAAATPPQDDVELRAGTTVGRYRITGSIGQGGMGVVYRAVDGQLGRDVALKFLSAALAEDVQAKGRFVREARALGALDHPNVGAIYELGDHGGRPFLALALYEGETLRRRVAAGPLPVREARRILAQIASGLAAAHAAGIIHRDVKPENVLVTAQGRAILLDFGLAKLLTGSGAGSMLTRGQAVLGTVAYCSPEQIAADDVDHRSDLWSLGVVGFEMITGVTPFAARTRSATALRIFTEVPARADLLRAPPELAELLCALMQKSPDARVQTAEEVARRLDLIEPDSDSIR